LFASLSIRAFGKKQGLDARKETLTHNHLGCFALTFISWLGTEETRLTRQVTGNNTCAPPGKKRHRGR
jgi:hypothetical protein